MKNARNGFTLIELLVVIAIIAILAALLLPALSQAKNKAKLATCQSNFHQVYIGCNIYAGDNGDWFPIWEDDAGGHPKNMISTESYNRYVVQTGPGPNTPVPTGVPSNNTTGQPWEFQNLGFLYDSKLIGDGGVLYCPSFASFAGSPLVEQAYSTPRFMSTDDGGNPSTGTYRVRSSICFNPLVDTNKVSGGKAARFFNKTSDMNSVPGGGHRLFGLDYIGGGANGSGSYNPQYFPHYPSKGWDVMFSDGSVKFCKSIDAYNAVLAFPASANGDPSFTLYMPVLLDLEAVP